MVARAQDELSGDLEKAVRLWMGEAAVGYMSTDSLAECGDDVEAAQGVVQQALELVSDIDAQNIKEACAGPSSSRYSAGTQRVLSGTRTKISEVVFEGPSQPHN